MIIPRNTICLGAKAAYASCLRKHANLPTQELEKVIQEWESRPLVLRSICYLDPLNHLGPYFPLKDRYNVASDLINARKNSRSKAARRVSRYIDDFAER